MAVPVPKGYPKAQKQDLTCFLDVEAVYLFQ